jgi:hypothetical protein
LAQLALAIGSAAGCGASDGLNRQAISGTVTCDGQPLGKGTIVFEPATIQSGTVVGSVIRQGNFAVERNQGPVPGLYVVSIYASSETQAPPAKGQSERSPRPMVERVPSAYNAESTLRAEVLDGHHNRFRFDVRSGD